MQRDRELERLQTKLRRYENALGRLLVSGELSSKTADELLRLVRGNGVALGVDHLGRIAYTTHGLAEALGMDRELGYDVLAAWRRRNVGPAFSKAPGSKQRRVRYPVQWVWDWFEANREETCLLGELLAQLEAKLGADWRPDTELGTQFVELVHLRRFTELARKHLTRLRGDDSSRGE